MADPAPERQHRSRRCQQRLPQQRQPPVAATGRTRGQPEIKSSQAQAALLRREGRQGQALRRPPEALVRLSESVRSAGRSKGRDLSLRILPDAVPA